MLLSSERINLPVVDGLMVLSSAGKKEPSAGWRAAIAVPQLLIISSVIGYQVDKVDQCIYRAIAIDVGSAVKRVGRDVRTAIAGVR